MKTMAAKRISEYVVYTVEYVVGVGLVDQPVYYVLGIYKSEEAAKERKKREEENAYKLGYYQLKFYVDELKVFDSKLEINNKHVKPICYEMQDTKRYWWFR